MIMPKNGDNVQATASSLEILNTVSVKVPAFWPDSAEAWFVQVEAQFALKGVIVSSTKFYYCVSLFNQETANQVLDLIKYPLSSDPYEALKSRLLRSSIQLQSPSSLFLLTNLLYRGSWEW